MVTEIQTAQASRESQAIYTRGLTSQWRHGAQIDDPSIWLPLEPDLEEKMLRDPDIAAAVNYRRHLIAGRQWSLTPRFQTNRAPVACMIGTALLEGIKHFTGARIALARAFFSGTRYGRIHGAPKVLTIGDGKPRTWWVPVRIEDVDKRIYRRVRNAESDDTGLHWERWNIMKGDWEIEPISEAICTIRHIYQDEQGNLGHGSALREQLGWIWKAKTEIAQEALIAAEKHGVGTLRMKVAGLRDAGTGKPNEEMLRSAVEMLESMRSRHVVAHDDQDEIDVIQQSGTGWQFLNDQLERFQRQIQTLVLGANMNTSADGGGSYALARVHENATEALIQFDRSSLEETLTDDLIGCVWHHNHANLTELGIDEEPPLFSIMQEKVQDPIQRMQAAQGLNAMGVELPLAEVLDQVGFRMPEPGEETIKPQPAPQITGGFGPFRSWPR